ncbi:MAG: hypothetical protein ABI809_00580 [Caldimonas sp.]
MKLVEYWRWRYRDPETGHIRRTPLQMSEVEILKLSAHAERIDGTMTVREVNEDPEDTTPDVFRRQA